MERLEAGGMTIDRIPSAGVVISALASVARVRRQPAPTIVCGPLRVAGRL